MRGMRQPVAWMGCLAIAMTLPAFASHSTIGSGPPTAIHPEYAQRLLDAGEHLNFIDLRTIEEFGRGHLPGARSLPIRELLRRYPEIPREGRVVLYCACHPYDIQTAYEFLRNNGYRNLSVLEEGFPGWVKRGYRLEP